MGAVPLGVLDGPIQGALTRAQRGQVLAELRREDLRRRIAEAQAFLAAHAPDVAREAKEPGTSR